MAIDPVWFNYNGIAGMPVNERGVGTIAQDLQQIAPYMISEWTFAEGSLDENKQEGSGPGATTNYLGVDYGPLNFIVINSIQEQQAIIESQKEEIDALHAQVKTIQETLNAMSNE